MTTKLPEDHTEALEAVDIDPQLQLEIVRDVPDFAEIMDKRRKLLKKVEQFTPVEDISQTVEMEDAKRLRLDLVKVRTGLDKIRKTIGDTHRKRVNAINDTFNNLIRDGESAESFLKESEDFEAIYEAGRLAELRSARHAALAPYGSDWAVFQVEKMTAAQFAQFEATQKAVWEKARADAAEADRLAREERERDRIEAEKARAELEKERKERAASDARAAEERKRLFAEQQEQAEKAEAERKAAQAKADEEQKKITLKLEQERAQRAALERAERERLEAVAAQEREKKAADAKAKRAPDKTKLSKFLGEVANTLLHVPTVKEEASLVLDTFVDKANKLLLEFEKQIKSL